MSCCLDVWLAHSRLLFALESPSGFSFSVFYVEGKTYMHTYTHTRAQCRRTPPPQSNAVTAARFIKTASNICPQLFRDENRTINSSQSIGFVFFSPCCCWSLRVLASSFSCCYAFSHLKSSFFGFLTLHSSLPAL